MITAIQRLRWLLFGLLFTQPVWAQYHRNDAAGCMACGGCGMFMFVIIAAIIGLHIWLLFWVINDMKSRNIQEPILWILLVVLFGLIGFVIYLVSRPPGVLVDCPACHKKRLQGSPQCPHCGNA